MRLWSLIKKIAFPKKDRPNSHELLLASVDRSKNVILMIVKETPTGAVLSSDFAERGVNHRYFQKIDNMTAIMPVEHARQCGLDDGWT